MSNLPSRLPRHVAIIMDGNGRWATARGLPRIEGHKAGATSVSEVVRSCREIGIKVLTLYSFSTENWKRPADEVAGLMELLRDYLIERRSELVDHRIRLRIIGQMERLPVLVRGIAEATLRATERPDPAMVLNLAISYGGRAEITRAVRTLAEKVRRGELSPHAIDEAMLASHLETAGLPDPDLLIRSSGEMRLSNFLLWQLAYSEIYVTDVLWPDFRRPQLLEALHAYAGRNRRFGGTA
jgi:undecaprenyl diphosphate synthase